MITIWSCTHLFRPTCLIINTCDQNWRENVRLPLVHAEIFPMDFPTLPYALIFSITGIAVEVLMVANDRGTECCCCWIVVNLWVVVAGCVSLWLVLDRCGSLWCRCGLLWVVPCFSNYDVHIIYGNVRICIRIAPASQRSIERLVFNLNSVSFKILNVRKLFINV